MKTLFKLVLEGMEDNNDINDAKFSDWDTAYDAIKTYGTNELTSKCEEKEMDATIIALNAIIENDGVGINEAIDTWNMEVWGQKFANNSGSVPFN